VVQSAGRAAQQLAGKINSSPASKTATGCGGRAGDISEMGDNLSEYLIAHEAGQAVVGRFVRIGAPRSIAFYLHCGADGQPRLEDSATASLLPPDAEILRLPEAVKDCLCYALAGGLAATQFSCLSLPREEIGLSEDRKQLSKLTSKSLESFVPSALPVIEHEQQAYQEVISQCRRKLEQFREAKISEGVHTFLDARELQAIFDKNMSGRRGPIHVTENNAQFRDIMSAHEAGHATLGIALGARIEAIYALPIRLPNGLIRIRSFTRFGALSRAGVDLKGQILLTAGGAAGEFLLNGNWDFENVEVDSADLRQLGVWNFDYCRQTAISLLQRNIHLLNAARDKIRASMSNLKQCKVARGGTHIVLAKGSEIAKLFQSLGVHVESSALDLDIARGRNHGDDGRK